MNAATIAAAMVRATRRPKSASILKGEKARTVNPHTSTRNVTHSASPTVVFGKDVSVVAEKVKPGEPCSGGYGCDQAGDRNGKH